MIEIAEVLLESQPTPFWRALQQIGVNSVVGSLPRHLAGVGSSTPRIFGVSENPWDYEALALYQQDLKEAGFALSVIEDSPPMDALRLGHEGRDVELEHVCTLVTNMGKLGIPVLCYHWMPLLGPLRTSLALPGRGGALVTAYEHEKLADAPLTSEGRVEEAQLWEALEWFLTRALPVAEKAGVHLAMHPDDPPISPVRGIARIMRSIEAFQRLVDLVPSPANGITFCQGNFTLFADDLPATIRKFGEQGKIFFVHFRDVAGSPDSFVETFHDNGKTDMAACIRAYRDVGYNGPLRSDHTPTLEGDTAFVPGYSRTARLYAIGYIKGLIEAVETEALEATA